VGVGRELCQIFLDEKVLAFYHRGETVVVEGGVWWGGVIFYPKIFF
jgi:hypothetical protein